MRGEYHLAAVRAGGGHQADQQRVEEGGDTLRGQGAPEREGPATTNQVSVFRAYQPIRAEYSEGGNLTDNEQILGKFKTSTSNNYVEWKGTVDSPELCEDKVVAVKHNIKHKLHNGHIYAPINSV